MRYGDKLEALLKLQDEQTRKLTVELNDLREKTGGRSSVPPASFTGIAESAAAKELVRELNLMGEREDIYKSWMKTGTGKIAVSSILVGADILINEYGFFVRNQEGVISFQDTNGVYGTISIYADGFNELVLKNAFGSEGIRFDIDTTAHVVIGPTFREDEDLAERAIAIFPSGDQGSRLILDNQGLIDLRAEGSLGGSTFIRMRETNTTPDSPSAGDAFHMYIKGDKFIIQFNDGGTVRYKYLDLTGTGTTWTHTTSAP